MMRAVVLVLALGPLAACSSATFEIAATTEGSVDAPRCPASASSASFDARGMDCETLIKAHTLAVADARTCGCDRDCAALECVDLCCECKIWLNPGRDAYAKSKAIEAEWTRRLAAGVCSRPDCANCADPLPTLRECRAGALGATTCR